MQFKPQQTTFNTSRKQIPHHTKVTQCLSLSFQSRV